MRRHLGRVRRACRCSGHQPANIGILSSKPWLPPSMPGARSECGGVSIPTGIIQLAARLLEILVESCSLDTSYLDKIQLAKVYLHAIAT